MSRTLTAIAIIAGAGMTGALLAYLIGAFILWEPNPGEWPTDVRAFLAFPVWPVLSVLASSLFFFIRNEVR